MSFTYALDKAVLAELSLSLGRGRKIVDFLILSMDAVCSVGRSMRLLAPFLLDWFRRSFTAVSDFT